MVYLIHVDGSAALVDAGCGRSHTTLLNNIRSCGIDPQQIAYLLITHCHFDHTGGAKALRQQLDCRTVAHELDAHFLESADDEVTAASWYGSTMEPLVIDKKLSGKETKIQLGKREISAIHAPGHSPGSVVYLIESEGKRVLFAQDVHGPLHPTLLSNEEDYRCSLKNLLLLEIDILCEGHFGVYEGKDRIRAFIKGFLT